MKLGIIYETGVPFGVKEDLEKALELLATAYEEAVSRD